MHHPFAHKQPTPKRLLLSLLSAQGMETITARECVDWGSLFAIEPTAMRVAVGRMVKDGHLKSLQRGLYSIGTQGEVLRQTARRWMNAEQRIGQWHETWLMVQTAHLARSNKVALRSREQALRLEGFALLCAGVWCRPANLVEPLLETWNRLLSLGLDREALLTHVTELHGTDADPRALWPRRELERGYASLTKTMLGSMRGLATLDVQAAARETFLIGESVIRQINADPLLPDAMIDAAARRTMSKIMLEYEARGREIWTRFQEAAA